MLNAENRSLRFQLQLPVSGKSLLRMYSTRLETRTKELVNCASVRIVNLHAK